MFLCGLQVTTTRQFQPTKCVGGALSKSEKMTVQTIPKTDTTARDKTAASSIANGLCRGHILAQLLFIRREYGCTPPARNGRHCWFV
jgi:hypothetical protein